MPDSDILLNADPEEISPNPGATSLSRPPFSITGLVSDYANRPQLPANGLSVLMDGQQMRDAGLHPEQLNKVPDTSVIDTTGASDAKADPSGGYAKAAGMTRTAVRATHNAASWLGRAPIISDALKSGQTVKSALAEAASHPMVAGLKALNTAYSVPLNVAEGVARAATDYRNGASWPDTVIGNTIRTGLVGAAGMIPYVGWGAAPAANRYLPDGAAMGHAYTQSFVDTDGRALLLP